ncbi:ABC transporter substrate-binding protein [Paenibacillus ginsengarvi]|uniref:ABC transporter substrate-binding protein n=1 Tax=Paenibacillus ginsengarvi TaxID=400777 RepID=A0A3B0CHN2_9BACL|nr:ABC transporter substrate-binding protein [Paenibacillus ginsengarvi]RKN84391.1 ABC transporter substrate-binding protein [Paenibacillus ginsengarvi]
MAGSYRKLFIGAIVALAVVLNLAGCSSQEGQADKAQTNASGKGNTAANGKESEAAKTRKVKDEFGEVDIPANPKRIAGVYVEDYLVALGVTPIVQWYHPNWGKQDYLGLNVPNFDITGSLEALIQANPELIIVDGSVDKAKYEQYSKIAPTYRLPEAILQNPEEILKTIADVVNLKNKGDEVIALYAKKVADVKEKLTRSVVGQTVAVLRLNIADKTLALFGIENRYTGNIYKEMGLTPHPFARDMKEFQAILSEEKIPELNAEHIIIFPSSGTWTSKENQEALKVLETPLWKSLPAVKKGNVYVADRTYWQSGAITANMMKMDDLLKWFVK